MTLCTAIVSALSGIPVRREVAMTGEITLRGRVLPIGGLKEKTMAAYRAGVKTVIIPQDNLPDLEDIDPVVKNALAFVPASDAETVLKAALVKPTEPIITHESSYISQEMPIVPMDKKPAVINIQ